MPTICSNCKKFKSPEDNHPTCVRCSGCDSNNTCDFCCRWEETSWSRVAALNLQADVRRKTRGKGKKKDTSLTSSTTSATPAAKKTPSGPSKPDSETVVNPSTSRDSSIHEAMLELFGDGDSDIQEEQDDNTTEVDQGRSHSNDTEQPKVQKRGHTTIRSPTTGQHSPSLVGSNPDQDKSRSSSTSRDQSPARRTRTQHRSRNQTRSRTRSQSRSQSRNRSRSQSRNRTRSSSGNRPRSRQHRTRNQRDTDRRRDDDRPQTDIRRREHRRTRIQSRSRSPVHRRYSSGHSTDQTRYRRRSRTRVHTRYSPQHRRSDSRTRSSLTDSSRTRYTNRRRDSQRSRSRSGSSPRKGNHRRGHRHMDSQTSYSPPRKQRRTEHEESTHDTAHDSSASGEAVSIRQSPDPLLSEVDNFESPSQRSPSPSPLTTMSTDERIKLLSAELDRLKAKKDIEKLIEEKDGDMRTSIEEIYKWLPPEVCKPPEGHQITQRAKKPKSRRDKEPASTQYRRLPTSTQTWENYEAAKKVIEESKDNFITLSTIPCRFNKDLYSTYDDSFPPTAQQLDLDAQSIGISNPRRIVIPASKHRDMCSMLHRLLLCLNFQDLACAAMDEVIKKLPDMEFKDSLDKLQAAVIRSNNDAMGHVTTAMINAEAMSRHETLATSSQLQDFRKSELMKLPYTGSTMFRGTLNTVRKDVYGDNANRAVVSSLRKNQQPRSRKDQKQPFRSKSKPATSTTVRRTIGFTPARTVRQAAFKPRSKAGPRGQRFSDNRPQKRNK